MITQESDDGPAWTGQDRTGRREDARGGGAPGELRRVVGPGLLFFFIVGDMLGGGIYALVGEVGAEVGGAIWTAFLAAFVLASMTAFWAGEFANAYVLARMKLWTGGRFLWMRTIGSTVVGQGLDSLIFYPLAFYGLAGWPPEQLYQVVLSQWLIKTVWEAALTPVTYLVVGALKRREGIDVFDEGTDFTPFRAGI